MTDDANLGIRRLRISSYDIRRPAKLYDDALQVTVLRHSVVERIKGAWWLLRGGEQRRTLRLVWNYRGHNGGLFDRGPNWWQITLPASRKRFRCALICTSNCGATPND